ncbi:phosphoribosylanthranilate isomerase [Psychroserpens sp. Hel_I_66]|uniref:phosphoribosylanthranilate isomerase n=1 Tax=Psychroserpens sp. Hel_I_66 TaxID=1250004 RepID=UPI000649247F|nr:phosphoribosylanthranilate isomerase [Psychroserpens sp. Hel_I_66]
MKLKICGMKYPKNMTEVAKLQPDYMGFIFYGKSSRFFEGEIPDLPKNIKKTGVFVDAKIEFVLEKIELHNLQAVQLHGIETPEYCEELNNRYAEFVSASHQKKIEIIKVFSIKDNFNFSILEPYEAVCDYFLFDTKGKLPGGNGYTFNWDVLKDYPSTKPYFLSGGIGLNEVDDIMSFIKRHESKYCHAIDVNSKFEVKAGLKNSFELEKFTNQLKR